MFHFPDVWERLQNSYWAAGENMKATATKSTDIIIFAMTITGDIVQSSRLRRVGDGYQVSTVTTVSEPKFTHMSLKKIYPTFTGKSCGRKSCNAEIMKFQGLFS